MMAGVTGLEPAASGVTGQRSNQLSYTPGRRVVAKWQTDYGSRAGKSSKSDRLCGALSIIRPNDTTNGIDALKRAACVFAENSLNPCRRNATGG